MLGKHLEPDQIALWEKIERYEIDQPGVAVPYSKKLAREQGWTPAFTRRVIAEYKRFIFLGMVAGHGVSPSEIVDEAWHKHILYTQDYFIRFCQETLGRPFHHVPSEGGQHEVARLDDQYGKTLASYELIFGEPAPADIWPRPITAQPPKERPRWRGEAVFAVLAFAVALVCLGCGIVPGTTSPFDYRGPDFLGFYIFIEFIALAIAFSLRRALRLPIQPLSPVPPTPIEVAYLKGGASRAAQAALVSLMSRGLVELDLITNRLKATSDDFRGGSFLEEKLLRKIYLNPMPVKDLATWAAVEGRVVADDLRPKGLVPSEKSDALYRVLPMLVAAIPPVLGFIKIQIGLARERPVGFLVLLVIVTGISALFFLLPAIRSRAGDAALEKISKPVLFQSTDAVDNSYAESLVLLLAISGPTALNNTPLDYMTTQLAPPQNSGSGSGGCSGGSGCGGGGGGGCGGGGGGCGGCSS